MVVEIVNISNARLIGAGEHGAGEARSDILVKQGPDPGADDHVRACFLGGGGPGRRLVRRDQPLVEAGILEVEAVHARHGTGCGG